MAQKERSRFLRLLVFFDLPVETARQRREYRLFRKALVKEGYLMVQQSVYAKLAVNEHAAESATTRLRGIAPQEGIVQVLKVTERQYAAIETMTGSARLHEEIENCEGTVVL